MGLPAEAILAYNEHPQSYEAHETGKLDLGQIEA